MPLLKALSHSLVAGSEKPVLSPALLLLHILSGHNPTWVFVFGHSFLQDSPGLTASLTSSKPAWVAPFKEDPSCSPSI